METKATQQNQQALEEGELYVVRNGELQHLERAKNDLPKVPISLTAHKQA